MEFYIEYSIPHFLFNCKKKLKVCQKNNFKKGVVIIEKIRYNISIIKNGVMIMKNGFVKVAAATPCIRVADPTYNVGEMIRIAKATAKEDVVLLVFPELCITGYTCADLFYSNVLLDAAKKELSRYLKETAKLNMLSVVGIPVAKNGNLYNCAAICQSGKLLGIVPKTFIPNYGEFSEGRYFSSAPETVETVLWNGEEIPFGTQLLFVCNENSMLKIAIEICEDLLVATPPSSEHAVAGATVICNLSASNELVDKDTYRLDTVRSQSARTATSYIYASSGDGESTTDLVFSAHNIICENGTLLAEKKPFDFEKEWICTEIDVERSYFDHLRKNTFFAKNTEKYREIPFSLPNVETKLTRFVDPNPFVPTSLDERARRCETVLNIQTQGLKQRIERAYAKKIVIGISGGLDSTLALLVMARAMDALKRPRTDIIAVTMPCFGTTTRTKSNATVLCEELGVDFRCVDIFDAVNLHFRDIGHDPNDRNVTYENSQARERTQILMDIANDCGGMVIGTGDLSELALGWATYNGDHMSMYAVNGSVPKTLIRHVVAYCADLAKKDGNNAIATALYDILDTPVSPELLPANENGEIAQKTEDLVGPYELHDFYLYYFIRFGFSPKKLYRIAKYAHGSTYSDAVLLKWLETFMRRFFSQQFKRSCLPDGPKVGSVGLSPRGDWKMPSDAANAVWLAEIEELKNNK